MHPREFIQINTERQLTNSGFAPDAVRAGVSVAIQTYDKTPTFPPGKCFDHCFTAGKRTAQVYQKAAEKRTKPSERESTSSPKKQRASA